MNGSHYSITLISARKFDLWVPNDHVYQLPDASFTKGYPAREPGAGVGLSGAPPTETGPTGLGNGGIVFGDARTTRARGFGRGMLKAVDGGMLEVVDRGMLEVVSGDVTWFCRELTCAVSKES